MKRPEISPSEFAKTYKCDPDWLAAMNQAGLSVVPWMRGDKVICNGYEGAIESHYHNGMFNVRLQSGTVCVDGGNLEAVS